MEGYHEAGGATPTRSELLREALGYARKGKPVFPLRAGGKTPAIPKREGGRGYLDATTDPRRINMWWNRYPGANIGVPTGERSGLLVLDVDPDEGGTGALEALVTEHGELPATTTARTGSGGLHYYFRYPAGEDIRNSAGKLGPGLDVRGEGGYVVAPPSATERAYEWRETHPPASPPEWLLQLLREPSRGRSGEARRSRTLVSAVPDGEPIPEGGRNHELTRIAGRLHDGGRTLEQLTADLLAINQERCSPPLPEREVEIIAASIHRYEPCNPAPEASAKVLGVLGGIEAAFWRREWKGMGWKSARDVMVVLIREARRHGRLIPAGVRVVMSVRSLALAAGVSRRSVFNAVPRLKAAGLLRQDNATRSGTDAGAFVLVSPRETLHHSTTQKLLRKGEWASGENSRAPLSAARLRWTKVLRERVGDDYEVVVIRRIGKSGGHAVDLLEAAGGRLRLEGLAAAMGVKRPRDLLRDSASYVGPVRRLEKAGVVVVEGDTINLTLTEEWPEALAVERERAGEIEDYRRDLKRYEREREDYRSGRKAAAAAVRPDPAPTEAEMDARQTAREAAGEIREPERAPAPEPALVAALRDYLDRNPHDHPDHHPPGDRRMQMSWLGSTLRCYELYPTKPSVSEVEVALSWLEAGERDVA